MRVGREGESIGGKMETVVLKHQLKKSGGAGKCCPEYNYKQELWV